MDTTRITGQDNAPVIACGLDDDSGEQAKRWMRLGRDAGLERVETEDGLRIRFVTSQWSRKSCGPWSPWKAAAAHGRAGRFAAPTAT
jgi:hypothetical protein